jgi:hypothetical protein
MNLQTLKNLPRKTWLIIVVATTVALSAGLIYAISGSLHRLGADPDVPGLLRGAGDANSLFAQIAAKETDIATQNAAAAKLPERQALLAGMTTDIAAARKRLPPIAQKTEVRQLFEDLGRQVGSASNALEVKTFNVREAPSASGRGATSDYKSVEYQVAVTADLDGIIQFINLIERNERFMTVEGIQLTTGGVAMNNASGKVEAKPHTAQLRIVTYIDTTSQPGTKRN